MPSPVLLWCLLLGATALTLSTGSGQPPSPKKDGDEKPPRLAPPMSTDRTNPPAPEPRPGAKAPAEDYTAFPDLKPWTRKTKRGTGKDGKPLVITEIEGGVTLPEFPELGANPSTLRKVQHAQLHAGLAFVLRTRENELIIGGPDPNEFISSRQIEIEVYRVAAELEEKPAKRVVWYEARVCLLKEIEGHINQRIESGALRTHQGHIARFQRLQAEADLLKLKAEVEKAGQ